MPMAMMATMAMTPTTLAMLMGAFRRYTRKPKTMAMAMNSKDTMATRALASEAARFTAPLSSKVAPKVPATMEAKAATTRISVR